MLSSRLKVCRLESHGLSNRCGTKSVSTFARRYRASKSFNLTGLAEALDGSIAQSLCRTQNRSFSHLYRQHKGTLYSVGSRRQRDELTEHPPAISLALDARHLLSPTHKRTFSASYRHHHMSLLTRLSKIFFPALLPPKETTQSTFRTKSVPEILASRSFSHAYRERQLAPIRAYLSTNPFSEQGRRSASSVPMSAYMPRGQVAGSETTSGRRIWRLRLLAAGITSLLALGFVSQTTEKVELPALSTSLYLPWKVVAIDRVSPTTCIFTLKTDSVQSLEELPLITSVSIKEPSANIQRQYTVLSSNGDTIQILVKRYDDGDLSRFIHSRKLDGILHLKQTSTAELPSAQHLLFIVGGTGIAPAYQCIRKFAKLPAKERPMVDVLYASRSEEEVYLRAQLDALQQESEGTVKVSYFIDGKSSIDAKTLKQHLAQDDVATVVCGSDGFITHIAGAKPEGGQGSIGGLLAKVGVSDNVLKL